MSGVAEPGGEQQAKSSARKKSAGFMHCRTAAFAQQALQHLPEFFAVHRIGQRELDEALEVAGKIADVVALLARRQPHGHHPPALVAQQLDGIGELDLAALVGLDAADHVEDQRREHVAAGDRQVARRVLRAAASRSGSTMRNASPTPFSGCTMP